MQPRTLKTLAVVVVVGMVGTAIVLRMRSVTIDTRNQIKTDADKPLTKARALVRGQPDLSMCRVIRQHLNTHLTEERGGGLAGLTAEQRASLQAKLKLDDGELSELDQKSFTSLDAVHLEACVLFRDAAAGVVLRDADRPRPPEIEAAEAFAWVSRQVALEPGTIDFDAGKEYLVPQLALTRGYGSPLMRALVFLRLLDQLGHTGCLLAFPTSEGKAPRYWACGVVGSDDRLFLFDPRMGLPIPGLDGQGIATLDELRKKDSPTLQQLDVSSLRYDVSSSQVMASEVSLAPPLSALAPRQRVLGTELLPDAGKVYFDIASNTARLQKALRKAGHADEVRLADWAVRADRIFFGEQERGTEQPNRLETFNGSLIRGMERFKPPGLLQAMPQSMRSIPPERLQVPPLFRLSGEYTKHILDFHQKPGRPRSLLLRGRLGDAGSSLGSTDESLELKIDNYKTNFKHKDFLDWYDKAVKLNFSDPDGRGAAEQLYRTYGKMLLIFVEGATALELRPQVRYLLALVKHEEGEQQLQKLSILGNPTAAQLDDVKKTWDNIERLWQESIDDLSPMRSQAEWLRAQCEQQRAQLAWRLVESSAAEERGRLTQKAREMTQTALSRWEDAAAGRPPLSKLAVQWQIRQLKKRSESK